MENHFEVEPLFAVCKMQNWRLDGVEVSQEFMILYAGEIIIMMKKEECLEDSLATAGIGKMVAAAVFR